jgi:hypothetical protein
MNVKRLLLAVPLVVSTCAFAGSPTPTRPRIGNGKGMRDLSGQARVDVENKGKDVTKERTRTKARDEAEVARKPKFSSFAPATDET